MSAAKRPLLHGGWRRRVSLLASGALDREQRREVERHLESCASCREEHAALTRLLELVAGDPIRGAEPPLAASVLAARVRAQLDAAGAAAPLRPAWRRPAALLTAAAAAAALAWLALPRAGPTPGSEAPARRAVQVPGDMLERMERTLAREQTARYLDEAGAVLVTLAAQGRDCDQDAERVDVAAETSRSRKLLRRGALLVDIDAAEVATARPVLVDVEQVLLEVAALEACARTGDLARIGERIARRRLLMKIDLMARELQG